MKYRDRGYRFDLMLDNDLVAIVSEIYATRPAALLGVEAVKRNASLDARYERMTATDGRYHFSLKAANGEVIAVSQLYLTSEARDAGIAQVMATAPASEVREL